MRAPLRGAHTSARLAPLADKLLASLAQFTHSMLLAQNHTRRQAPSAHRSRCSLIQRSQTGAICPSLALLAHSAHAHWRHLPIARVARSFSTFLTLHLSISQIGPQTAEKKHLLHSSSDPWWPIRAPPGGNGNHDLPDHPPKFQPNRPTDSCPFTKIVFILDL